MLTVSMSTLVSVVLVFLFIIFFLLISRSKPTQNQVNEMKETGWEIVQTIEQYVEKMEEMKLEVEQKMEQLIELEERIVQQHVLEKTTTTPEPAAFQSAMPTKKATPLPPTMTVAEQKTHILDLYHQGWDTEEIAEQLNLQKGIVGVVVNIEKMKKQA